MIQFVVLKYIVSW